MTKLLQKKVKSNPILVESSGLKFKIEADDKKIYSLIPIPPKEKTEKIDEKNKNYDYLKIIIHNSREYKIINNEINCIVWLASEYKNDFKKYFDF